MNRAATRLPSLLLVLALPVVAQQAPATVPNPAEPAAEQELARLVNQERVRAGVHALQLDARVAEAARLHARRMAERRTLEHQFAGEPDLRLRLAATGLTFDQAGENIALNDSAAAAHQDLLTSPGHRANMLSPDYNAMGIGVAERDGRLYIAEDFAYRTKEYSPEQAEDVIAAAYLGFRRALKDGEPRRLEDRDLRARACTMGQADELAKDAITALPGARALVTYTATRPERLPAELTDPRRVGWARSFAVGACFARTPSHPEGVYWVMVALY